MHCLAFPMLEWHREAFSTSVSLLSFKLHIHIVKTNLNASSSSEGNFCRNKALPFRGALQVMVIGILMGDW